MIKDKEFTNRFNLALEISGLTDGEAARLLKVSKITIQNWKNGQTAPHEIMYDRLFKKLEGHCIYRSKGCNKITKRCKRLGCVYAKYFDFLMTNF